MSKQTLETLENYVIAENHTVIYRANIFIQNSVQMFYDLCFFFWESMVKRSLDHWVVKGFAKEPNGDITL